MELTFVVKNDETGRELFNVVTVCLNGNPTELADHDFSEKFKDLLKECFCEDGGEVYTDEEFEEMEEFTSFVLTEKHSNSKENTIRMSGR